MPLIRRFSLFLVLPVLILLLASCQGKQPAAKDHVFPIFGNGGQDLSEVIATVGPHQITQQDLDLRLDEMVPRLKRKYEGDEGRQLLLKEMVDETLLVMGAQDKGLPNRSDVARTLITQKRATLVSAMRNVGIPEGAEPTEEDLQTFFKNNRQEFKQEGMVHARHIECKTQAAAQAAYLKLKSDTSGFNFMKVAADYSSNTVSLRQEGDLGWYNRNGVVPFITDSQTFIKRTFDLDIGLHPPIEVAGVWHVVEILDRKPGRPMTYGEARDLVKKLMMPGFIDGMVKDYLLEARKTVPVELKGGFAPGKGLDPETLMKRAALVGDPQTKLDYYRMIYTDFPTSDRADDALFMCAMVCMDTYKDRSMAERYLDLLLDKFPDSELHQDAQFLKDNLYRPGGITPETIEELKGK